MSMLGRGMVVHRRGSVYFLAEETSRIAVPVDRIVCSPHREASMTKLIYSKDKPIPLSACTSWHYSRRLSLLLQ